MSTEIVINLIALVVAIMTLVLMAFRLGLQINNDSNSTKNDRPSSK
jgi:hypothetical protein